MKKLNLPFWGQESMEASWNLRGCGLHLLCTCCMGLLLYRGFSRKEKDRRIGGKEKHHFQTPKSSEIYKCFIL